MSGKTITDKRIDIERKKTNAICEQLYEKHGDLRVWSADRGLVFLEIELAKALRPRPLSTMDVRVAFNAYVVGFKKACRKHGQQA